MCPIAAVPKYRKLLLTRCCRFISGIIWFYLKQGSKFCKIRLQKATKRRKQRQNNTWFGMVGCKCKWRPHHVADLDNIDDLSERFLRVLYDIFEEVAFNLETQHRVRNSLNGSRILGAADRLEREVVCRLSWPLGSL